ncbi:MAG: glycerol-3-phosphate 1-O-acyltransferase PlsY [Clostridia bacterium]|nr:glycerol-3-phosphate 1-O-acyltransferase PlsY [Clostridia bacterium]MBQ7312246.1 glycerol-3-phosphate 1-O-acyltransferase PlsY [Clostridia bacterium]
MLHLFLRYEIGFMGLIGYFWKDVPLIPSMLLVLVYVLIPYLLGSINTAILVSRHFYHDDIRKYGSGNAGFTNVMRTYGKKAAIITFAGDILKTLLAILVGWCVFGYLTAYIAGFACFLGHIFPVFYNFKGGKGVLCMATIMLMLDWRIFCALLVVFIGIVMATKYISAGSVICAMMFPLMLNRMNNTGIYMIEFVAIAIAVIVVIKHRENLKRIFNGTESKFKIKKSKETGEGK